MQKRNICVLGLALFGTCLLFSQVTDRTPAVFYFGGKQFYVGMSTHDALTSLSVCCKLSPPADSEMEQRPSPTGKMLGHFILPKEPSDQPILGSIYFADGKVALISRDLAWIIR